MKLDRADILFSLYIRQRDKWTCQKCHTDYTNRNKQGLDCSHFYGRAEENTRYDVENCIAFCSACHSYMDGHPEEYRLFKRRQLGEERYDTLVLRGNTYCKKDRKMRLIEVKLLLKELEKENEKKNIF